LKFEGGGGGIVEILNKNEIMRDLRFFSPEDGDSMFIRNVGI
jgi:hypothetical protein